MRLPTIKIFTQLPPPLSTGYRLDQVTKDQRRFAKSVNFGLLYGMSAFRLARESDLTLSEAQAFRGRIL